MDRFIRDMSNGTCVHLPPMPYLSNFWKYKQEEPPQNRLAARAYENWLPLLLDEDAIGYHISAHVLLINIEAETAGIYTVSIWKETFSRMGSDKLYAVSVANFCLWTKYLAVERVSLLGSSARWVFLFVTSKV